MSPKHTLSGQKAAYVRRLVGSWAAILVISLGLLAGCATTAGARTGSELSGAEPASSDGGGRVAAAARFSLVVFETVGDIAKECKEGVLLACNPVNYIIAPMAGIVWMPMGFGIGLASEDIKNHYCGDILSPQADVNGLEFSEQ